MPRIRLRLTQPICGPCKRHRQKCSFAPGEEVCQICLQKGYDCRGSAGDTTGTVKKLRNRFKCDYCQSFSLKCNPTGRAWPSKCEYCEARGLPCTVPRTKRQAEVSTRATDDGAENDKSNAESELQQTIRVASDDDTRFLHFQPGSSGPDSEESDVDSSAPPVPPAKNEIASDENTEPSELEQMKGVVRAMEGEFEEILRAEKQKHQDEIEALEPKHWEELNQLRKQYEERVDNLIGIIKKLG